MTVQTPWGYEVASLESMIAVEDFRELCPGMSATDDQVQAVLNAVSSAIRDYCGWHVAPSMACTFTGTGEGDKLFIPAMGVTDVASLSVDGCPVDEFEWLPSGVVRVKSRRFPDTWRSVACTYTAGFDAGVVGHVVAQIASNAIAAAPGVSSERVGDVSVAYNQTGAGITGGVSLLDRDKELLTPYKLVRSW